MKNKTYIGITGAEDEREVKSVLNEFSEAGYNMQSKHIPMLGFLVSYKTLNRQFVGNKRYPLMDSLPNLLMEARGNAFTMVHYNTKEMSTLFEQVSKIFERIYKWNLCDALQLNIVWPDITQVKMIKEKFPDMGIVFQASEKAMNGKTPKEIANKIMEYGNSINYVLIDPSGGEGREFQTDDSINLYNELKEKSSNLAIGFAGGFSGDNVEKKITDIIEKIKTSDFCIDAEGGLRDKLSEEYGDDFLNIKKVRNYLQEASKVLE